MKRKILAFIITLVLMFPLYSCGGPSPTDVATDFLTAIQVNDTETLKTVYAGKNMDLKNTLNEQDVNLKEMDKQLQKELVSKLQDFEYEISDEKIDGSNATVKVKVKTYQFGQAFADFFQEYLGQAFLKAFSGASEDEISKLATDIFSSKLKEVKKNYEKTVKLKLVEKDDKWVVATIKDDDDFFDALSGGLVTSIGGLADSFDEAFSQ